MFSKDLRERRELVCSDPWKMAAKTFQAVRFDDTELDEDSMRKLKEQFNETDDNRKRCLESLRKKLLEKEDLNPCLDETVLIGYFRLSKFDVSKACQRILAYYGECRNSPEMFNCSSPKKVKIAESGRQMYAVPYRLPDHSALIIQKRTDYDTSKISYEILMSAVVLVGKMLHRMPLNQLGGITVLADLKTSSWGCWKEYTPARLHLIARIGQKITPFKVCGVHVINAPPLYYYLYSIIQPFLSTKIKNRIFLHKNLESLHSCIDPEMLPKEYGGCLEHSELINLYDRLDEHEDYFRKQAIYGYAKKKK